MSTNPLTEANILKDSHEQFAELPILFRDAVCEECNWSIPTFYRKMRAVDKPSVTRKNKVISAISNADKEKISQLNDKLLKELWNYFGRYRKGGDNKGIDTKKE
ncbi:hypothetical protein [Chitinophaga defluvii]|uniref:Uncharacterized protein n=1 Tax=Chitinophaga defluvii TaxID=3163343 RepID=A0ABV2T8U5_9BACT